MRKKLKIKIIVSNLHFKLHPLGIQLKYRLSGYSEENLIARKRNKTF